MGQNLPDLCSTCHAAATDYYRRYGFGMGNRHPDAGRDVARVVDADKLLLLFFRLSWRRYVV
jgi:hypothetical protein